MSWSISKGKRAKRLNQTLEQKESHKTKYKFQGKCYYCGKMGHKSVDCRLPKNKKNHETNIIDDISKDVSDINLVVVVSEVNLLGSN